MPPKKKDALIILLQSISNICQELGRCYLWLCLSEDSFYFQFSLPAPNEAGSHSRSKTQETAVVSWSHLRVLPEERQK